MSGIFSYRQCPLVFFSCTAHFVNETGQYELFAVLTHKGRMADSGHYIAWIRQDNGMPMPVLILPRFPLRFTTLLVTCFFFETWFLRTANSLSVLLPIQTNGWSMTMTRLALLTMKKSRNCPERVAVTGTWPTSGKFHWVVLNCVVSNCLTTRCFFSAACTAAAIWKMFQPQQRKQLLPPQLHQWKLLRQLSSKE